MHKFDSVTHLRQQLVDLQTPTLIDEDEPQLGRFTVNLHSICGDAPCLASITGIGNFRSLYPCAVCLTERTKAKQGDQGTGTGTRKLQYSYRVNRTEKKRSLEEVAALAAAAASNQKSQTKDRQGVSASVIHTFRDFNVITQVAWW
jgi:hypothetical protein